MQQVNWRRNLWILLFGTFITGTAFNEVIPFMSLYIIQLGNYSRGELSILSGIVYSCSFVVVAVTAPMWGRFADKHGRKWMILQTSLGSAIVIALMGVVTNVWQFIALRTLQGFFDGVIPNSIALVATEMPKRHSEYALSLLSTGYTSGFLIGPIFGGFLVHVFSIRLTFFITGLLLFSFFILSLTSVNENFKPDPDIVKSHFSWHFMKGFPHPHLVGWMFVTTIAVQMAINDVFPIITLFVKQLMHNHGPISLVAGIIAALPGISMVMTSPSIGKVGDHHGTHVVLGFGLIFSALCYFPQGAAAGVLMLGIFRFLNGIGNAAIFPSIQTCLAKGTPASRTGMAFSLNQGFQAIGIVLGSIVGGLLSDWFSYSVTFYVAGVTILLIYACLKWFLPELKKY